MKKIILLLIIVLFAIPTLAYEKRDYTETITATFDNYTINENLGYEFLTAGNSNYRQKLGELMVPQIFNEVSYPKKTAIENTSILSFEDPVEIELNLPILTEKGLGDRICPNDEKADIIFDYTDTDNTLTYLVYIYPLEVIDCEAGKFRLYQKAKYSIKYFPFSPIVIKDIEAPSKMNPGEQTEITIKIKKVVSGNIEGKFLVKDRNDKTIGEKEVKITDDELKMNFKAPDERYAQTFTLEYMEDDEVKTSKEFSSSVVASNIEINAPDKIKQGEKIPLNLKITSEKEQQTGIRINLEDRNNNNIEIYSETLSLKSGSNGYNIQLDTKGATGKNNIWVILDFDGEKEKKSKEIIIGKDEAAQEASSQPSNLPKIIAISIAALFTIILAVVLIKLYKK